MTAADFRRIALSVPLENLEISEWMGVIFVS